MMPDGNRLSVRSFVVKLFAIKLYLPLGSVDFGGYFCGGETPTFWVACVNP